MVAAATAQGHENFRFLGRSLNAEAPRTQRCAEKPSAIFGAVPHGRRGDRPRR